MDTIPITKKLIAFGSKKIYLPKFTIAFIRTPRISPYHARFLVPLDFSKYDLRDYLYHAYNVRCFNIRSFVRQMPVRDTQEQKRHWFRPESEKYMTVEMEQPFVWPETPDLAPWGQQERRTEIERNMRGVGGLDATEERNRAKRLRDHVQKLLNKDVAGKKEVVGEQALRKRKGKAKELSVLEAWEKGRQGKISRRDEAKRFIVKA